MIAHCVNMIPGTFTHTYGDLHIYTNHLDQVKEQLAREPMKLPSLWINPEIKDLFNLKYEDVKLVNYVSHPAIKGEVAVWKNKNAPTITRNTIASIYHPIKYNFYVLDIEDAENC